MGHAARIGDSLISRVNVTWKLKPVLCWSMSVRMQKKTEPLITELHKRMVSGALSETIDIDTAISMAEAGFRCLMHVKLATNRAPSRWLLKAASSLAFSCVGFDREYTASVQRDTCDARVMDTYSWHTSWWLDLCRLLLSASSSSILVAEPSGNWNAAALSSRRRGSLSRLEATPNADFFNGFDVQRVTRWKREASHLQELSCGRLFLTWLIFGTPTIIGLAVDCKCWTALLKHTDGSGLQLSYLVMMSRLVVLCVERGEPRVTLLKS